MNTKSNVRRLEYIILLITMVLSMFTGLPAQNPEWIVYTSSNSGLPNNLIWSIAIDPDGDKWIGTFGIGLVRFDGNNWTVYDKSNSGLPGNYIRVIEIDKGGNIWISVAEGGDEGPIYGLGLAKFDGDTTWQIYNYLNSDSPDDRITDITADRNNNIWVATLRGLAEFDGINWTVYDTLNSDLPENLVESIAVDSSGNVWAGLRETGLVKFDGVNWTLYNVSNSGLPDNDVRTIAVDPSGIILVGTGDGYAEYDGNNWIVYHFTSNSGLDPEHINSIAVEMGMIKWLGTEAGLVQLLWTNYSVFNTANSGFPVDLIYSLAIDEHGNKWAGSFGGGLVVFNEGGVVGIQNNQPQGLPEEYKLSQNYPNPFNPITTIRYDLAQRSDVQITIYDLLGRKVITLVSETQDAGYKTVIWDATNNHGKPISAGVYLYQIRTGEFVQTKKMILLK